MASARRRPTKEQNRNFNPRWEHDFGFIPSDGKPLCLLCMIQLTYYKSSNLRRHYETHHRDFMENYPPQSEARIKKLEELKAFALERPYLINRYSNGHKANRTQLEATNKMSSGSMERSDPVQHTTVSSASIDASDLPDTEQLTSLTDLNLRLLQLFNTDSNLAQLKLELSKSALSLESTGPTADPPPMDSNILQTFLSDHKPNSVETVLENNLTRIENAFGCFVCPVCSPAISECTSVNNLSSYFDPLAFDAHLASQHAGLENILCVYCCLPVRCTQLVRHIIAHFLNSVDRPQVRIYSCPASPVCPTSFETDQFHCLEAHWLAQHSGEDEPQRLFSCVHCNRSFTDLSSWGNHIRRHARTLVHCSAPGCLVKSPSRKLLIDHFHSRHSSLLQTTTHYNASVVIRETMEMVCNQLPAVSDHFTMYANNLATKRQLISSQNARFESDLEPAFVFILRCPNCSLTTVRWQHFLIHPSTCPGNIFIPPIGSGNETGLEAHKCRIFWCSKCQAVSTEEGLVNEHAKYSHEPSAFVVRENLKVQLLPANFQASDPPSNSTLMDFSIDPTLSTIAGSKTAFSATTTHLSSSPNYELGISSPMNLSALARPSSSKLLGLTDRSKPAVLSNLSSAPLTSISGVVPRQHSSISNDASMTLLQSAAALKTLQELATSGEVGDMTASAVAAMAAAAISGFTNFDVSNSLSASTSACTFTNTLSSIASNLPVLTSTTTNINPSTIADIDDSNSVINGVDLSKSPTECRTLVKKGDARSPVDSNKRNGEDMVSFPFDEEKFRTELSLHHRPNVVQLLVSKMRQFSSYFVRILGKENHRRIPVCPECEKVFPYGLGDFKRHLLTVHLEIPREYLKECLRFTYLPKSEEKFQEVQEQLAMRQMKPRLLEAGKRRVPLPYSIPILRRLTSHLPISTRDFLEEKMQLYSRLSVIVDTRGGFRRYKCNHCSYSSPHALADVRKHILGSHCGISTKHFRHCLQASRLDPVEFTLFPDEKLARLARDFLHRRQSSGTLKDEDPPVIPLELDRHNDPCDTMSNAITPSSLSSDANYSDGFVSHFTTVVPGSKNPVTVRIRPPVPPETKNSEQTIESISSGTVSSAVDLFGPPLTPTRSESSDSVTADCNASAVPSNLEIENLPSIPGLEGADGVFDLNLPFSEPVLRQLLQASNANERRIEDIVAKMKTYSTYTMNRICRLDRTIAFRCPCGRLFVTKRQPDSKIRAATLADSRRHVMGVHARIPHEFITVCCQASRITREHDFRIYPDEMLLRLAMDRPVKHSSSLTLNEGFNSTNRSGTLAFKPLKELVPLSTSSGSSDLWKRCSTESDQEDNLVIVKGDSNNGHLDDQHSLPNNVACLEENRLVREDESDFEEAKASQKGLDDPLMYLTMAQESPNEEVERVITLPYSSEALYSLVQGYCPAAYFPILEEKMDVYSSLKVFITRRRGRRYFCCSACTSASPHGMGDIRKHILGVHAKVPERYKAAAMHCSRLSREDNTLLPDNVLLHLAKMKWKGTVIKPLAEMDFSQFGQRRASTVGMSRQSGQFASQVYQPSAPRDSEKLTVLNAGNDRRISTGSTSPKGSASPNPVDDGFDNSQSSTPLDHNRKEFVILRMAVNPDHVTSLTGTTNSNGYVYTCSACEFNSGYIGALRAHIVRAHLNMPAHKCAYCDESFLTRKAAVNHHQKIHTELEFHPSQQSAAYRKAMAKIPIKDTDPVDSGTASMPSSTISPSMVRTNHNQGTEDSYVFTEETGLFEDDLYDDEELDTNEYHLSKRDGSPVTGEHLKPSKYPRLDSNHMIQYDDHQNLSTVGANPLSSSNESSWLNGTNGSSTLDPTRATPSGSSRRKPSKLRLVQLKPSEETDLSLNTIPESVPTPY